MDGFDQLPDALILQIFNSVSDAKTLIRCRSVSKRFNSLVPETESLLLKVDRVISPDSDSDSDSGSLLLTLFKSLLNLLNPKPNPTRTRPQKSPAQILSIFTRIRDLSIELPSGDLQLGGNAVVKWKAEFGNSLKRCVVFGFRCVTESDPPAHDSDEADFAGGLKGRVVWTISALIAASARHFLLREVVRQHRGIDKLVLSDREEEGTVVMDEQGLRECREEDDDKGHVSDACEGCSRTVVPNVRMRMRHVARVRLKSGVWVHGATLVVVRPCGGKHDLDDDDADDDVELGLGAFGSGVYGEAVKALVKTRSYLLEMNSF